MSERFVDFRIIKQRVSIQDVLGHYRIQLRQANRNTLRGRCPLPTHSSVTSRESFSVALDRNIWACQSASCAATRNGKKGGNAIDLVAVMEDCSIREAALKLDHWFPSSSVVSQTVRKGSGDTTQLVAERRHEVPEATGNTPLTFSLKAIDPSHPYIASRGILEETARRFGVGFFPGRGSMSGRVVIPISNERGELLAYAGRAIDDAEPKYRFPSGFKKSEVLWNLDHIHADDVPQSVVVVEGFFDTMKVVQAGFPNVVALMGSTLSEAQEELLVPFREIVLMLDGDQAGQTGSASILTRLARSHFVRVLTIAGQPDQLSSEEIQAVLAKV